MTAPNKQPERKTYPDWTDSRQPTPPPGMRLLTPGEYGKPTPEGTMLWIFCVSQWEPREHNEYPAEQGMFYAIPITVPSTGDTTNEKGGDIPCSTTAINTDGQQKDSHVQNANPVSTVASNAALAVPSHEQRQAPLILSARAIIEAAKYVHKDILEDVAWNPEYTVEISLTVKEIRAIAHALEICK